MELEFIQWLRRDFASGSTVLGDDAAVLPWSDLKNCIVATDLVADGVHFELTRVGAELAGRKALAVNLSDMAAMAARPIAAFVSLLLPRDDAAQIARRVMIGMQPLAEQFHVEIAGGDTNVWDGRLVLNVAILGTTDDRSPWTRQGMQPGDWLLSTGEFGGSRHGHHLSFCPRVQESLEFAKRFDIHAAIDVSDGLSLDASRLATESGCGVVLDRAAIPIASAARTATAESQSGHVPIRESLSDPDVVISTRTPLEHALYDGEDFELLMAVDERQARDILANPIPIPNFKLTVIGYATSEPGLWITDEHGVPVPAAPRGFEHGSRP